MLMKIAFNAETAPLQSTSFSAPSILFATRRLGPEACLLSQKINLEVNPNR
jgi:hypothetical protein